MSDEPKPPVPSPEEMTARLRATMLRDRSRFRRHLGLLLGLTGIIACGIVWWIYRQTSTPPLMVIAFDNICVPAEECTVRACLEAIEGEPLPGYLGGLEISFSDLGGSPPVKAKTIGVGQASALLSFSPAKQAPFLVRFAGMRRMSPSEDRAMVYFFEPSAKILLVDVHDLLADPATEFASSDVNQIAVDPKRAKTLQASQQRGRQIVYLALKSDRAQDYRLARRWIQSQQQYLPPGPLLGRPIYHERQTEDEARRQIVSELSSRFEVESQEW